MSIKIGRNDPCPCGSGKKYKACCLASSAPVQRESSIKPQFRFEPGSYKAPGAYLPSIACLKQTAAENWHYHFVLVCMETPHDYEADAVTQSTGDLNAAFEEKQKLGRDEALATALKARGYVSVSDFKVASDAESSP